MDTPGVVTSSVLPNPAALHPAKWESALEPVPVESPHWVQKCEPEVLRRPHGPLRTGSLKSPISKE